MTPNSRTSHNLFGQPDPIIPDLYQPLDYNRYAYTRFNPLKYTDPSGHICVDTKDGKLCSQDLEDESDNGSWWPDSAYVEHGSTLPLSLLSNQSEFDLDNWVASNQDYISYYTSQGLNIFGEGLFFYEKFDESIPWYFGFGVDGLHQGWKDFARDDLSIYQRVGRATLAATEGIAVDYFANLVGASHGASMLAVSAPSGSIPVIVTAVAAGYGLGYINGKAVFSRIADQWNEKFFYPFFELGEP